MKQMIVAMNCPKGGVGKTTLSKELASTYALTEINGKKPSVCVVDANIYFGDINSMLKLHPSKGMEQWADKIVEDNVAGSRFIYPFDIVDDYLIKHGSGMYILSAPNTTDGAQKITYPVMNTIIENLKNYFDIIILDTGNNTNDCTISCFEQANKIMIVVTDETTSINCAISLFSMFPNIGISMDKIEIIVNKYPIEKSNRCFSIEEIEEVMGGIFATVSMDEKIPMINSSGIPAVMGKDTPFKKDIFKLAKKLVPEFSEKEFRKVNGGK